MDIGEVGVWVYAVYSTATSAIYVGQTGGVRDPRAIVERFLEEVGEAKRWHKLYGAKGLRGPYYIRTLNHLGWENFCVIPVLRCNLRNVTRYEIFYITSITPNLNTIKKQPRQYMRWLVRAKLHRGLPRGVLEDKEAWDGLVHRKKITLEPLDAIEILAKAKGSLRREKYEPLQSRLVEYVRTKTGVRLPKMITLRIPYADKHISKKVKHAYDAFLHTVPYPKPIRAYLRTILNIPHTTAPKLSNVFCRDRVKLSLEEMATILAEPQKECVCHDGDTGCRQKVVYEPSEKVAMFGEATETLLRANLNRTVFPTWEKTERCTAEELLSMRRKVPKLRPFKFHNFQNAVYNITKGHLAHLKNELRATSKAKKRNFT